MTWIDAHVHAWDQDDAIWIRGRVAALSGEFPLAALKHVATDNRVSHALLVQAAQSDAETRRCIRMAEDDDFVAGVVGWVDLHSPQLDAQIDALRVSPKLVGFRPLPHSTFGPGWWGETRTIKGLRSLARSGNIVDILAFSSELADVARAVAGADGLRTVLNHGGRPNIMCGGWNQWAAQLRAVAVSGEVYCKCSGLVERAGIEWTFNSIHPYLGTLLEVFGTERLMFASNWPVLNIASTYRNWIETVLEAFVQLGLDPSEVNAIMGGNAARCYALAQASERPPPAG